jgi:hypothetical protein
MGKWGESRMRKLSFDEKWIKLKHNLTRLSVKRNGDLTGEEFWIVDNDRR